jgi:hypothetical protein
MAKGEVYSNTTTTTGTGTSNLTSKPPARPASQQHKPSDIPSTTTTSDSNNRAVASNANAALKNNARGKLYIPACST